MKRKHTLSTIFFIAGFILLRFISCDRQRPSNDYPIQPMEFNRVTIEDGFWKTRIEINREVTIPFAFKKSEETGRIENFAVAGGLKKGKFQGRFYNDSDVYKIIEGASYSLALHPDPGLEKYLDSLIAKIAAAQEDDGYLYTARTTNPNLKQLHGTKRWEDLRNLHELYNVGHLYEAAVAHFRATGKRTLLNVAIKNADLVVSVFGPGKKMGVPGHEEIEIGLAKLYRVTGNKKYLNLAKFFLDQRGNVRGHNLYGEVFQDHQPVVEQSEAVGHAVRAGYLYSGMADVAAIEKDRDYIKAIDRIWENIVSKKMYLTGGVGSSRRAEKFGENYDLPNRTAYNETCAAVAELLFNYRLFLLHGDAKYLDVFERILYNGFLSGVSLAGDRFFYPNPLEADGKTKFNQGLATRSPWFNTSCCPSNIARFMPSIGGYIYAHHKDTLFVNLFVNSRSNISLPSGIVRVSQQTNYPWEGRVNIMVEPQKPGQFTLLLRIPGWAENHPVPGDLYHYLERSKPDIRLSVNQTPRKLEIQKGFAVIQQKWGAGDRITLDLPLQIHRVTSKTEVAADRGRIAFERGPLVYCAEGIDNNGRAPELEISDSSRFQAISQNELLNGVTVLQSKKIKLIPYFAWSNRGAGKMEVWLKRKM